MTKDEAHALLNRVKMDKTIPVNKILDALELTGDLSNFDRKTDRTFSDPSFESCYVRTRAIQS